MINSVVNKVTVCRGYGYHSVEAITSRLIRSKPVWYL